jgi:RNA polymerase sigma-70 factor (ECF subfamily)
METDVFDAIALAERPRLLGLAYRMLGSYSDAEDVVQDALLRFHAVHTNEIISSAAYLTTVTTRLAIDHLRSARVRRESYVGPWLPEPIASDPAPDASSRAVVRDSLSIAFLVMLERLSPTERAVLVLHDVFAYTHAEIGSMLDRSDTSCRQLLRRARQRIGDDRAATEVPPSRRHEVVRRFVSACEGGDFDAFLSALMADVELVFDGGPTVKTAARRPIRGADRVARFLAFAITRTGAGRRVEPTMLNGGPAALIFTGRDALIGAVFIEPDEHHHAAVIRWIRNPSKLQHLTDPRPPTNEHATHRRVVRGVSRGHKDGDMPDGDLPEIGAPATRALAAIGITRLDQVAERSEAELLALHGFGPRALSILRDELAAHGRSMRV